MNKVLPVYPDLTRRMQLRDRVKVEAIIGPNGTVNSTKVVGGNPVLAVAAVDAVRHWKYAPSHSESNTSAELRFDTR